MTAKKWLRLERESPSGTLDTRRYYPDQQLTRQNMINWDRSGLGTTEVLLLDGTDINLGAKVLAIEGILGIVVWPGCLQARIADPAVWIDVEPQLATVLAEFTGAETYQIVDSPQQIDS